MVVAVAAHGAWLPWFGTALMHDDGPAKADIAVVLAGDYYGRRIEKAAELAKAGWVPAVLVSGPPYYGAHECDIAIDYIVKKGYPADWFIAYAHTALSTRDEAWTVLGELKRRHVGSFLLVSSTYHTGRAGRIFRSVERAMGGGPPFRVVGAEDMYFRPDSWWRSREGQKTVFLEWWKSLAAAVGD
jgi:uncharacterized SAM-binding protein YcdF (DUF218 family)